MFEKLWNAQPTAAKRRIHFTFRDSATGDNKDPGSLTGKKANIRLDGSGANVVSTNDVAAANQADHLGAGWVELTAAELTAFGSGELIVSVSGITGVKVEDAQATLYPFDPNDAGLTAAAIATQVRTELTAELARVDVAVSSRASTVSLAAATANLDATVSSRASAAALAAGVTLTAGERTTTIAALLGAVIETNGGNTLSVKQVLQLIGALVIGKISGITPGTGVQTTVLRSATDLQAIATYTDDDLGNRTNVVATIP
jgi:hypothetical protein